MDKDIVTSRLTKILDFVDSDDKVKDSLSKEDGYQQISYIRQSTNYLSEYTKVCFSPKISKEQIAKDREAREIRHKIIEKENIGLDATILTPETPIENEEHKNRPIKLFGSLGSHHGTKHEKSRYNNILSKNMSNFTNDPTNSMSTFFSTKSNSDNLTQLVRSDKIDKFNNTTPIMNLNTVNISIYNNGSKSKIVHLDELPMDSLQNVICFIFLSLTFINYLCR